MNIGFRDLTTRSIGRHAGEPGIVLVTVLILVSLVAVIGITVNRAGGVGSVVARNLLEKEQAYYTAMAGAQHALFLWDRDSSLDGACFKDAMDEPIRIPFAGGSYGASVTRPPAPMGDILITANGISAGGVQAALEKWRYNVKITALPPLTKDVSLDEDFKERNFGALPELTIGAKDRKDEKRSVLEFDFSAIPSGATILSATLELYMYENEVAGGNPTLNAAVHRMTRAWQEGTGMGGGGDSDGATWVHHNGANEWASAGGDFQAAAAAQTNIQVGEINQWHEWDVTALVQYWIDNPSANDGLILRDSTPANSFWGRFYSREYGDPAYRPKLTVVYAN